MENNKPKEDNVNKTKCEIWKRRTSLEKYLVLIVITIFILFLIFIVLFLHIKMKYDRRESVCLTPVCKEEAGRILQLLDFTIDPCENFYNFACGNFMKYRKRMATSNHYYHLDGYMNSLAKEVLEKPEKKNEPEFVKKLKMYYQSCLNRNSSIQESFEYFLKELKLKEWNLVNQELFTLEELMAKTSIYRWSFFSIYSIYKGHFLKFIKINKGYTIVGNFKSLNTSNEEDLLKVKNWYMLLSQIIFSVLKLKENNKEKLIEKMIDLQISLSDILQKERKDNFTKLTISQLETDSDCNQFRWTTFFKNLYKYSGRPDNYSDTTLVKVQSMDYIKDICSFIKENDRRDMYNLIIWNALLSHLSEENKIVASIIENIFQSSSKKNVSMRTSMKWESCIENMPLVLDIGLQSLRLKYDYDNINEKIAKIANYTIEIMNIADETFAKEKWLDDDSRNFTRFKVKNMGYEIGYDDVLLNETFLNKLFDLINVTDIYIQNTFEAKKFMFIDSFFMGNLSKALEDEGIIYPYVANAFFMHSGEDEYIVIPLGILQPPFYAHKAPNYLNYGAIGSVIGHEIFHGFDRLDVKSDDDDDDYESPIKIDWPENFLDEYRRRKECFIKQYSEYPIAENVTLDGNSTVSENIADNCGLFHSFWAYERYLKKHGEEPKLPGLDFTNRQMFFIRATQMECEKVYNMKEEFSSTSHSPGIYRSLGPLRNFPDFSKAFKCPKNSFMNPENKCTLFG
ncbi:endothelin-converting enzyme 1-like [Centruroides sculpturatus]|uniref:endothelin-converting enzyme 1-like n=1 Tax=Centruroides sculpturatus TaxID=218467 RepID=UPI000C6CA783|nr:endothelin-converting enzyme 1-like [Centruroides sculpturatus]